jgi:hypothetical protein
MFFVAFTLVACSSKPSQGDIETAIAKTQEAKPTEVKVPQTTKPPLPKLTDTLTTRIPNIIVTVIVTVIVTPESLTSTPEPTNTPKPTSTPEPPTTPTLNIPPLEILSHQSNTYGVLFHIIGEVRNNANVPMEVVKIIATLYDQDNKVSGTSYNYPIIDVIPPGGKSPFEIGTDKWEGTTSYKLQVQGREGDLPRQDLVILSSESYKANGWLHILGEVKNTGETEAKLVELIISLYDVNGILVGFTYTYTTLDTIPPGETSPFEVDTDHFPIFDHYEIQVQGR